MVFPVNKMTDFQLGWLVGIVEGEGSIMWTGKHQPIVKIAMTDLDVLERVRDWTGIGNIVGPFMPAGGKKQAWMWTVGDQAGFREITDAMRPHLSARRQEQLTNVLAKLAERQAGIKARKAARFNPGTGICVNNHDRAAVGVLKGTNKCLVCHRNRSRKART